MTTLELMTENQNASNAIILDNDAITLYETPQHNTNQSNVVYDGNTKVTESYTTAATSKGSLDGRVSDQWRNRPDDEKFTSLQSLYDHVLNRSIKSSESVINPSQIEVTVNNESDSIALNHEAFGTIEPSNYAFSQICALTQAPAGYLRSLPAQLAGINLQYGLTTRNAPMKAFSYKNGVSTLRAMTSESYGRIHDYSVVEEVMKLAGNGLGETRWKIPGTIDWNTSNNGLVKYNPFVDVTKENTTLYASDRDVYLFLVDDTHPIEVGKLANGEPDLMFRGFVVWNSEVGSKTFGLATMMLRGVCANRNLWGVEGVNEIKIRHSKNAPDRFIKEAAPMLLNYSEAGAMPIINKVRNAKATIIADTPEERIDFLTKTVKLSKPLADSVISTVLREEEKPMQSIWDVVQGMTAVARKIQHQDARIDLETKAGKLMDKIAA